MRKKNTNVKKLVLAALFIAIIIVMTAVPYTGYIEYVPGGINMTTLHIPVIIGAVFLGWKYGALLGIYFSFWENVRQEHREDIIFDFCSKK